MKAIKELERMVSFVEHPVQNTIVSGKITLNKVAQIIKSDRYKEVTETYRNLPDGNAKKKYKLSKFDMVLFSGDFDKRNKDSLIEHSGLAVIDLDNIPLEEIK